MLNTPKDFRILLTSLTLCTKSQETSVSRTNLLSKHLNSLSKFWRTCTLWAKTLWKKSIKDLLRSLDSLSLPIKILCKSIASLSWSQASTNMLPKQFCIWYSIMPWTKEKRPRNCWSWATFHRQSASVITILKLCTIDVLFKSVLMHSILESIIKFSNSCHKSAVKARIATKPVIW